MILGSMRGDPPLEGAPTPGLQPFPLPFRTQMTDGRPYSPPGALSDAFHTHLPLSAPPGGDGARRGMYTGSHSGQGARPEAARAAPVVGVRRVEGRWG